MGVGRGPPRLKLANSAARNLTVRVRPLTKGMTSQRLVHKLSLRTTEFPLPHLFFLSFCLHNIRWALFELGYPGLICGLLTVKALL